MILICHGLTITDWNISEISVILLRESCLIFHSSIMSSQLLFYLVIIIHCCYSNAEMDLGCMTYDGNVTGFLGNALSPPLQYIFTLNFTINPEYYNNKFDSHPVVCKLCMCICMCVVIVVYSKCVHMPNMHHHLSK